MITINLKNIEIIPMGESQSEGGSSTVAGVEAINLGNNIDSNFQKTGIVKLYTDFYDGSYDVAINGTSFYGLKPIDDTIIIENAGGTANGNFRCGIKVNPNCLGSNITSITMGEEDYGYNTFGGKIKLTNGWKDLDDDGVQETYDVSVGGEYPEGSEWGKNGGSVWFGFTSTDGSIQIGDYSSRLDFKVSDNIMNRIAALEQEIENLKNN